MDERKWKRKTKKEPKRGYVGLLVCSIFMCNSVSNFRLLVHVHECDLPKNYKKKESWMNEDEDEDEGIGIVTLLEV